LRRETKAAEGARSVLATKRGSEERTGEKLKARKVRL